MNIAFDLSQSTEHKTGIETYFHQMTMAILKSLPEKYEPILISNDIKYLEGYSDKCQKVVIKSKRPNFLWMILVSLRLRLSRVDIFIAQSNFMFSRLFPRTIQVVYDLAPFEHPEFYDEDFVNKFQKQLRSAVKYSKHLVTISQTTLDDLRNELAESISKSSFIGSGLKDTLTLNTQDSKQKFNITGKYILSVGTIQPRKNYVNMIKAFEILKRSHPDYSYVIVGKEGWMFDEIISEVNDSKIKESIIFTGFVSEGELALLYSEAELLLNCSIFEGFGLPLIEAYSFNCPVVCSDIPIFREVMQDKATYVDQKDPVQIANSVTFILNSGKDELSTDSKFLEQYSWSNVGNRMASVVEKMNE